MTQLFVTWDVSDIIFSLGSIDVRWYGILYATGFVISYILLKKLYIREDVNPLYLDRLAVYVFVGLVAGARLGHCLFYEPGYYLSSGTHFIEMLIPFHHNVTGWHFTGYRGLASHGGAVGILLAMYLYSRKYKVPFMWVADRIVIAVCFAGVAIRTGNLMNSEIYGVPTSLPWGFVFVNDGQTVPCHPTQIYEALAYCLIGVVLYFILMKKKPNQGIVFGLFLSVLFAARFLIEFLKNDQEAWEKALPIDMGQILSLPFIIAGVIIVIMAWRRPIGPALNLKLLTDNNKKKQ